jgi:hypothetical protein
MFCKYYIIQKYLKIGKQSLRIISKWISESVKGPVTFKWAAAVVTIVIPCSTVVE